MAVDRVFLHIGTPKTGTTYLQELLWHHREVLARHGVHYPAWVPEAHFLAALDLQRIPFNEFDDPAAVGAWVRLVREVQGLSGTAVISHELLGDASAEVAERAIASFAPAEVHLVVTARDLARQLPAAWQEDLKNTHYMTFEHFVEAIRVGRIPDPWWSEEFWRRQDVPDLLERWGGTVPADRVHVVTVPPPGAPRDVLWRRFAAVLGVDAALVDPTHEVRTNKSLTPVEAHLLRRINLAVDERWRYDWPRYGWVVSHLIDQIFGRREGRPILLPVEEYGWARERAERMVAELRAAGYDVVGDLDELLVGPPPASAGRHPDDVTDEELLDAALHLVVNVLFDRPVPPPWWPPPPRLRDQVADAVKDYARALPGRAQQRVREEARRRLLRRGR